MKILENFQENILGKSNINNIFNEDPQLYERSIHHGYGPKMFPNFKNSHSVEYIWAAAYVYCEICGTLHDITWLIRNVFFIFFSRSFLLAKR